MQYPDKQDKAIAKAILGNSNIDEEARLKMARVFDPTVKSIAHAFAEDVERYQKSMGFGGQPGRVPEPKTALEIHYDPDGNIHAVTTRGGEWVSEQVIKKVQPRSGVAK